MVKRLTAGIIFAAMATAAMTAMTASAGMIHDSITDPANAPPQERTTPTESRAKQTLAQHVTRKRITWIQAAPESGDRTASQRRETRNQPSPLLQKALYFGARGVGIAQRMSRTSLKI